MSRASNAARALPEHGDGESDGGGRWVLLCRVPSPVEASLLEGLLEAKHGRGRLAFAVLRHLLAIAASALRLKR